jgi:hypothetical protein
MAFAASASATKVTTTAGGAAATPAIHAVNEGGHIKLANPIANIECSSTVEGTVTAHGAGVTVSGLISGLTFFGCTNSCHVTTTKPGTFEVHWENGHNGILTSTGFLVNATRVRLQLQLRDQQNPDRYSHRR